MKVNGLQDICTRYRVKLKEGKLEQVALELESLILKIDEDVKDNEVNINDIKTQINTIIQFIHSEHRH